MRYSSAEEIAQHTVLATQLQFPGPALGSSQSVTPLPGDWISSFGFYQYLYPSAHRLDFKVNLFVCLFVKEAFTRFQKMYFFFSKTSKRTSFLGCYVNVVNMETKGCFYDLIQ